MALDYEQHQIYRPRRRPRRTWLKVAAITVAAVAVAIVLWWFLIGWRWAYPDW